MPLNWMIKISITFFDLQSVRKSELENPIYNELQLETSVKRFTTTMAITTNIYIHLK